MDDSKLEGIKKKIDSLKVISYEENIGLSNGKFMSIVNGKYNLNNGKTIFREKINKNIGIGSAVCIFTVTKDNNIVLVIEPRCALPTESKVNIEIPAGYIDNGEDKLEAAKRELKEETGYIRDAMKLRNIHGTQKIECLLVPTMISATTTAEELSAAAVTRGIENPAPKTSMIEMKFGVQDFVCLAIGVAFCVVSIMVG